MKGSYFIAVQATSACIYTIHVKVYRDNSEKISTSIKQIALGQVESGNLEYDVPQQFYFVIPQEQRKAGHETSISLYFNAAKDNALLDIDITPTLIVHYHYNSTIYPVLIIG